MRGLPLASSCSFNNMPSVDKHFPVRFEFVFLPYLSKQLGDGERRSEHGEFQDQRQRSERARCWLKDRVQSSALRCHFRGLCLDDGLYGELRPMIECGRRRDQLQGRIGNETGLHCQHRGKEPRNRRCQRARRWPHSGDAARRLIAVSRKSDMLAVYISLEGQANLDWNSKVGSARDLGGGGDSHVGAT